MSGINNKRIFSAYFCNLQLILIICIKTLILGLQTSFNKIFIKAA